MSLFKVFNNFSSGNDLPNTYVEGYCYFDKNTGKFYVDTNGTSAGRMAFNALRADQDKDGNDITETYLAPVNTPADGQVLMFKNGAPTWSDLDTYDGTVS